MSPPPARDPLTGSGDPDRPDRDPTPVHPSPPNASLIGERLRDWGAFNGPQSVRHRDSRRGLRSPWLRTGVAAVAWLLVWQVASWAVGHTVLLVSPVAALGRLFELLGTSAFWGSAGNTLGRIALGFLLGFLCGAALAGLASRGPWPSAFVSLPVRVIRSVPVVSVIILILIWADAAWLAATVAALMVLPVSFANVEEGLASRDVQLRELADVYDLPGWRRWWGITLPGLLPFLTAAARTGMGLAWKAGVSAEVIGLAVGSIGERLYEAKLFLSSADLFAWTLVVVVAALVCERAVLWLLAALRSWLAGRYATRPARTTLRTPPGSSDASVIGERSTNSRAFDGIQLAGVGFRYPGTDGWTLRDVCAELPSGGVLRLDGPNGAGKTTLLKLILGLLTPTVGRIEGVGPRRRAAVFQEDRLVEHLTAIGNVRLTSRRPLTNAAILAELAALGLDGPAAASPVSALSGGQRRRVCLARALLSDAEVLGLDEPFTGIDADALPGVQAHVRARSAGLDVVLITHDQAQADFFGGAVVKLGV